MVFDGIALALALLGTGAKAVGKAFKKAGGKAKTALSDAATTATKRKTATTRGPLCRSSQCFPAGTPIRVAEGTRPIETIRSGDLVWSCDPEADVWSLKQVVETYEIDYVGELATIELDSGDTLVGTAGHPFWVEAGEALEDRPSIGELEEERRFVEAEAEAEDSVALANGRWVHAGDLRPGDLLVSLDLGSVVVEGVSLAATRQTTHNFHVADLRTYAVGENGILVHNNSTKKSCDGDDETGDDETEEDEDDKDDGKPEQPKIPLTGFEEVAAYLKANGTLPDNFITKQQARDLGWVPSQGNLAQVAPGKSIGGDPFGNREGKLPSAPGRTWHEADINYSSGFRGDERLVYSSDGLIYKTTDHYQTFHPL